MVITREALIRRARYHPGRHRRHHHQGQAPPHHRRSQLTSGQPLTTSSAIRVTTPVPTARPYQSVNDTPGVA